MAYQKFTGEEFIDTELTPKLNDNFDAVNLDISQLEEAIQQLTNYSNY